MKVLKGIGIGVRNEGLIVKNEDKFILIEESELGGKEKPKKAKALIGAPIHYVELEEAIASGNMILGSRKKALEVFSKHPLPIEGDLINCIIIFAIRTFIVVEYLGREIYIHASECSHTFAKDVRQLGLQVGDKIQAKVIGVNPESEDPIELSIKALTEKPDIDIYKVGDEYVAPVVHILNQDKEKRTSYIVSLPINDCPMLCPETNWAEAIAIGDQCVVRIKTFDKEKHFIYGILVTRIKRGN